MTEQPTDPNQSTPAGEPVGETTPSKDDRNMAMIAHLLGIVLSFIGPLIIWLIKREESAYIDDQGKEALNFQITVFIAYMICSVLSFALIGCLLFPLVLVVNVVFCIMAGLKAAEGVRYRYPFALRLIK